MKRLLKTVPALFLSFTMAVVMLYTPHFSVNASAEYYQGDIITLGEYPQTKVTDESLVSVLNYLDGGFGTVSYEGERYKKVYFEEYICVNADHCPVIVDGIMQHNSMQYDNGYYIETVYWFKYEPIRWIVLENYYGELLLLSESILNARAYNDGALTDNITWSNSTLRTWLNDDFYLSAFSLEDRSKILLSNVVNYDDPFHGTNGGANTNDNLFLLSYYEATSEAYGFNAGYNENDSARLAEATDYAKCNGVWVYRTYSWGEATEHGSYWHLRTTGETDDDPGLAGYDTYSYNSYVKTAGNITYLPVYNTYIGVRPAMKINSCVVTFDANGGTGGTSTAMLCGDELVAPAVERPGHVFLGWDPEVPETVPEFDTTYTAQWVKTDVRLTKLSSGMEVNIQGWEEDKYYQIWTYQKIVADFLLDGVEDAPANQWILSQAYAPASSGSLQGDDSVSFYIDDFNSPDDNYTVAVRMIDSEGSFVREMRDSYTSEEVSEVKITKVLVDDEYSIGIETKEISNDSQVVFTVVGNALPYTYYYARVVEGNETLEQTDENEFVWHTSSWSPGQYTVELSATNSWTSDTKNIQVQLYSLNDSTDYAEIEGMYTYLSGDTASALTCELVPIFSNGTFWYRVSEPGRAPIFTSGLFYNGELVEYLFQKPGIYLVSGFVNRQYEVRIGGHYDDGIIKTVTIPRDDATGTPAVSLAANVELPYVEKGTDVLFTANASSLPGPVEYSFWRYDAKGYVLVKDWSSSNTLAWTPARIGNYSISVRAKGAGAGSYEAVNSLSVEVYDNDDDIARGVSISINEDELNEFARPRAPIVIKATATSQNSEDLLYKFNISDNWMGGRTVQHYSANSQCIWTPRKEGVYTVSVLVKNSSSFGMYDAVESFEITVEDAEDPWDPGGGVS